MITMSISRINRVNYRYSWWSDDDGETERERERNKIKYDYDSYNMQHFLIAFESWSRPHLDLTRMMLSKASPSGLI